MMKLVYLYLLTLPVFFGIDMLWIGVLAKGFYRNNLGHLLRPDINWAAALIFYLLYIVGILIFATLPALEKHSLRQAVSHGRPVRFFRLRHLRPFQPGNIKGLAGQCRIRGYSLGHVPDGKRRSGKLLHRQMDHAVRCIFPYTEAEPHERKSLPYSLSAL